MSNYISKIIAFKPPDISTFNFLLLDRKLSTLCLYGIQTQIWILVSSKVENGKLGNFLHFTLAHLLWCLSCATLAFAPMRHCRDCARLDEVTRNVDKCR